MEITTKITTKKTIEIQESFEQLQEMLDDSQTEQEKKKLEFLICVKTGEHKTKGAISRHLDLPYHRVSSWFDRYLQGGLEEVFAHKSRGKTSKLSPEVIQLIATRIEQKPYFQKMSEIKDWLWEAHGIDVAEYVVAYNLKKNFDLVKTISIKPQETE